MKKEGRLKIFLGYAAGSGKTYAMLEAAHEAKAHGIDIVAGYIEPHARPDTRKMAEGLELIPAQMVEYRGIHLREFDIDEALRRKPQLILVDELAHTNAPGCRNEKRYQDVQMCIRDSSSAFDSRFFCFGGDSTGWLGGNHESGLSWTCLLYTSSFY